ncbi:uncharacterized protein SOCG_03632 [Schizosaccharomyces octosporus yFS286]|uniref:Uncharacterized protein n=1 Tax=Schizosaccharomyces octosporus (strain yFS286) TaxID=483514 RepID=S9Q435_SCHOY|nr:uncharacterized protein SOCG_03632 [Schizosaccharomyces octosporus yFS286]EPX74423.1 hypothetical protein SOCG_03632 [Schizosaccharomyces octosporus yFS286]
MELQSLLWLILTFICVVWIISRPASYNVFKSCGFLSAFFASLIEDVETTVYLKLSSLEEAINCFEEHNQPSPVSVMLEGNLFLLHQRINQMKKQVSLDFQKYNLRSRLYSGICYLLEYKRFKYSFKRLAKKTTNKTGCSCKLSQCKLNRLMAANTTYNRSLQKGFKKIRSFLSEYAIKYLIILVFLRAIIFIIHKFSLHAESPNFVKLKLTETWSKNVLFLVFFIFCLQWDSIFKLPFRFAASPNIYEFMADTMIKCKYPSKKTGQLEQQNYIENLDLEKRKENIKVFLDSLSEIRSKEEVKKDFTFEKVSFRKYLLDNESYI